MKAKIILGATLLMLVASSMPVDAYHITAPVANTWNVSIPFVIICESDGPLDPRNPAPAVHGGNGGLCTSGLNAVTVGSGSVPMTTPAFGAFSMFDLLDDLGNKNTIGYEVEIGVTFCEVFPSQEVRYREIYAWYSYDGPGGAAFHGHVTAFYNILLSIPGFTSGTATAATASTAGTNTCGASDPLAWTPVHLTPM